MKKLTCTVAAAAAICASASADEAFAASGHTLKLSAPAHVVVGKPAILHATGTIPQDELAYPYWFSLDAIPTSVTETCPADRYAGAQLAQSTGGSIVVLTQRETPDAEGNFSIPIGVTPTSPGSVLLCAYSDDGLTNTLAGASLVLHIERGGTSGSGSGPAQIARDARSGIRSCRALLSGSAARSCVHRAVKQANARCRKLKAPRKRTQCLRAVRATARG